MQSPHAQDRAYLALTGGRGTALQDDASSPRAAPRRTNCSYTGPRQSLHSGPRRLVSHMSGALRYPLERCEPEIVATMPHAFIRVDKRRRIFAESSSVRADGE